MKALLTSGSQVRVLLGSPLSAKNKCNFGEQLDRWLLIFPLMFPLARLPFALLLVAQGAASERHLRHNRDSTPPRRRRPSRGATGRITLFDEHQHFARGRGISRAHHLVTAKDLPERTGQAAAGDARTARNRLDH